MAGQTIALATKGIILCLKSVIRRCVLPLSVSIDERSTNLSIDPSKDINISLKSLPLNKLDMKISRPKLDIIKRRNIKIDLEKCGD